MTVYLNYKTLLKEMKKDVSGEIKHMLPKDVLLWDQAS